MTIKDTLEETYTALKANKVRSGLTMLGIIIGISSVIAMVSIGNGAQSSINSSIESIGSNLLEVLPGAQRTVGYGVSAGRGSAQSLTQADADAIASQVANVNAVTSEVSGRYQVTARGTNTNTSVDGVASDYTATRNVSVAEGNFISDQDVGSINKVAVIGPTAAADLFATGTDPVGQIIRIKNIEFTIIGETVAKGGSGFGSQDDMIFIPSSTATHYLSGNQYLTTIDVQAASADVMTQVQNDITSLLLSRHNIQNPASADFNVLNQADILATASSVTQTFTLLLAAVAGISLIVGGIGIMNMMLTTVTERTREIGLRKAIGAQEKDITLQFLIESIALTVIGGTIGIALGWAICFFITYLGIIATTVSLLSVALAFGVSAAIGVAFGYYPARRAAKMNPIEALRYE
jgi:putative ABC transport system permease protein